MNETKAKSGPNGSQVETPQPQLPATQQEQALTVNLQQMVQMMQVMQQMQKIASQSNFALTTNVLHQVMSPSNEILMRATEMADGQYAEDELSIELHLPD